MSYFVWASIMKIDKEYKYVTVGWRRTRAYGWREVDLVIINGRPPFKHTEYQKCNQKRRIVESGVLKLLGAQFIRGILWK